MALPDLATTADLSARGITPTDLHEAMLTVASSLVRGAAGSPILETTSTVVLTHWGASSLLPLPGLPIRSVASVAVDGTAKTDWTLVDGALWSRGWGTPGEPTPVTVTMTHGLPEVPPHIVQLVCDLAILGANSAAVGARDPRVIAERIDDYSVQFADASVASAMELPIPTRRALRAAFGGGAGVTEYR